MGPCFGLVKFAKVAKMNISNMADYATALQNRRMPAIQNLRLVLGPNP